MITIKNIKKRLQRSEVLKMDGFYNKIKTCEHFIYYDAIAMAICGVIAMCTPFVISGFFCFGLCLFSSWYLLDIMHYIQWYSKYKESIKKENEI